MSSPASKGLSGFSNTKEASLSFGDIEVKILLKFSFNEDNAFVNKKILEICLDKDFKLKKQWVDVRPIPEDDLWFENVWNRYMKDEIVR